MATKLNSETCAVLLQDLKQEISQSSIKAHFSVNKEMISLYWSIGNQILERQKSEGWSSEVIENISKDLRSEFPEMKALSIKNLKYMRSFAEEYQDHLIVQELLAQITWDHNITLLDKVSDYDERLWYANETVKNGWSKNVMLAQIQRGLYASQGKC
jgi:predicted nuclease of restriction endonuclease-like (RecB) superfamily